MASVTRQEVKGLFQAPSPQLLASLLPPTSLRLLDCSALSVLETRWILGVSKEGGREQDLGRGERAGQMSGPLLISPPPATPARCSLEASGFMTMTRLWSLGVRDKLGQMSQSRYFIYSRSPRVLLLSQSPHSPLSLRLGQARGGKAVNEPLEKLWGGAEELGVGSSWGGSGEG